jgi:serine protease AprX
VAERLEKRLKGRFELTRTVYNRSIIASELTLNDLLDDIIPMSGWYINLLDWRTGERRDAKSKKARDRAKGEARVPDPPKASEMWEDIVRPQKTYYTFPELLAPIRMAGVIGFHAIHPEQDDQLEECLRDLSSPNANKAQEARDQIVKFVQIGLTQGLKRKTAFPAPEDERWIFAVNRNRQATLALKHSVKTVKGDAATRLFNIECKRVTWAIMDCGIDARHPALLDRSKVKGDGDPSNEVERFEKTRITETYDFTHLHDLLLGKELEKTLPSHYLAGEGVTPERLQDIKRRISRSQNVDWELLRPVLRVPHEKGIYPPPNDSHGTHVAGILGANWPHDGDPIFGMCPDIRMIDLRVCRPDGTSDEFIIISALQFLRHLNANADNPYILGVNMSLSIPHDTTAFACGQTPVCVEAERTVASGVVVVAAAGNVGYRRILNEHSESIEQFCPVSITDPGNAESVITVGSTHRISPHTYGVSYFSSRGPTGDGRIKPDILAPGEKILAPALDDKTLPLDGTSMAAPHVSGAAAMLMARHVELKGRPDRIKQILCSTATDLGRERYFQGHGLVDVLRALQSV